MRQYHFHLKNAGFENSYMRDNLNGTICSIIRKLYHNILWFYQVDAILLRAILNYEAINKRS
jgi:hypothetical protein